MFIPRFIWPACLELPQHYFCIRPRQHETKESTAASSEEWKQRVTCAAPAALVFSEGGSIIGGRVDRFESEDGFSSHSGVGKRTVWRGIVQLFTISLSGVVSRRDEAR